MTEVNQMYRVVRKYLSPYGRIERIENRIAAGWPDYYFILRQISGWLECKLVSPSGRCPDHLTIEQIMWGEAEIRAGGRWFLLARSGASWWLMNIAQVRAWREGAPPEPIFSIFGRFPLREILDVIAPLAPR